MKYIIEIKPEYEDSFKGIMILGAKDSNLFVDTLAVENLEELNSDYINEHFGGLQDTAYQRGLEDGRNEAWEAVRKIVLNPDKGGASLQDLYAIFGNNASMPHICRSYSASEAIEKLKAYEEKQNTVDKIEVGDEVAFHHDDRPDTVVVVTYIGQDGFIDGMDGRGTQYAHKNPAKWTKTGRHFDIASILKEMQS